MTTARPGASYHELSWDDFDSLALTGGDVSAADVFKRSERTRVLLLLRAIVNEVGDTADMVGPLAPLSTAWDLLARVQETEPGALYAILDHPFTGSWAAHTIRRLRTSESQPYPLWSQLGNLHALAASAAIRAGIDARLAVPMLHGTVVLPTLGAVRLDEFSPEWSTSTVHVHDAGAEVEDGHFRVHVPEDRYSHSPGWWGLRRLVSCSGTRELVLCLDDLDPYRGLRQPIQPARVAQSEIDAWAELLQSAWGLVCQAVPHIADVMPLGLNTIVPGPPAGNFREVNASSADAFGSAVIGRPRDDATLGAILVHEFSHIQLNALMHLIVLYDDQHGGRYHYAPWRDDPRPLGGILQGIYAFAGATSFWRGLARCTSGPLHRRAAFEFARWRTASFTTLCRAREESALTNAGRRFLNGVADRLGSWQDEEVAAETIGMAGLAAVDHYLGWRIRYLRLDAAAVLALARAWPGKWPDTGLDLSSGAPVLEPDGPWARDRADHLRTQVIGSGLVEQGDNEADQALATGSYERAAKSYIWELTTTPDKPSSWAGLAMAMRAARPGPASELLFQRPELVHAVCRAIRSLTAVPPEPLAVAAWIANGLALSGQQEPN